MSPGGPYELKIEGNGSVRRFLSSVLEEDNGDTPAIRRIAPRNVSLMFIIIFPWRRGRAGSNRSKRKAPPKRGTFLKSTLPQGIVLNDRTGAAPTHTATLGKSNLGYTKALHALRELQSAAGSCRHALFRPPIQSALAWRSPAFASHAPPESPPLS